MARNLQTKDTYTGNIYVNKYIFTYIVYLHICMYVYINILPSYIYVCVCLSMYIYKYV